jgi:hypothetical protein
MERRNSPRTRCRLRCELVHRRQRASGKVLDISAGGLSVHTQLKVEQGEPLLVRIEVPSQGSLELETMVWHIRRGRRRDSGELCNLLGLMVSKAPPAYYRLLPHTAPDEPHAPERTPEPEPRPLRDLGTDSPGLCPFRIRVKARSGSRTRVLSLSAESESEARALAISVLDDEWHILEVQSA